MWTHLKLSTLISVAASVGASANADIGSLHDLAPKADGQTVPKEVTLATNKQHNAATDFNERILDDAWKRK
jgi:hypothetical protein